MFCMVLLNGCSQYIEPEQDMSTSSEDDTIDDLGGHGLPSQCTHPNFHYHTFSGYIIDYIDHIGGSEGFVQWYSEGDTENGCGLTIFDLMQDFEIEMESFKEIVKEDSSYDFLYAPPQENYIDYNGAETSFHCTHSTLDYHSFSNELITHIGGYDIFWEWYPAASENVEDECPATIFDLMDDFDIELEEFQTLVGKTNSALSEYEDTQKKSTETKSLPDMK